LASSPPYLLFEENRRPVTGLQPDAVPHVAVDDDGPAFDYADVDTIPRLVIVVVVTVYIGIQNECLSTHRAFATDDDPLVVAVPADDDVTKDAHRARRRFCQSISLLASTIVHASIRASAGPCAVKGDRQVFGMFQV
jgi:hypothetical protein